MNATTTPELDATHFDIVADPRTVDLSADPDTLGPNERREWKALREMMSVVPGPASEHLVHNDDASEVYTVDTDDATCTCPDHKYRNAFCKHQRRVAYTLGERDIKVASEHGKLIDGVLLRQRGRWQVRNR